MSREPQLWALSLYHALNDGSLTVFLAALPIMRVAVGLSFIEIGTILSLGLLATVLMQFVFGFLADHGYARKGLVVGLVSIAVIDLVFTHADSYSQVLVFYVLLRAAGGAYHPVSFSTIFQTLDHRFSLGFQSAFGDASIALAMVTTGFAAESFGWQIPFYAWGVAACLGAGVFISLTKRMGRSPSAARDELRRSVSKHVIILQIVGVFLQCIFVVFTGFMPLFLNVNLNLSPGVSTLVVALWMGIGVTASFNAGRIIGFFRSELRTLRMGFGLTAIVFILAFAAASMKLWCVALILLVVSGLPHLLTYPVLYSMIGITSERRHLGLAYATNLSFSYLAGSAVSYATGYLSSTYSLAVILPILALSATGASITTLLL